MSNLASSLPRSVRVNRGVVDGDLMLSLEERITSLVERHREALKTIEELRTQLQDRDSEIGSLSERLERRERLQEDLRARLDRLIERIGQMQGACETSGSPA
jgi:chromosome segregation ATPase